MRYLVLLVLSGCTVGDQSFVNMSCDAAHACPGDLACFRDQCVSQAAVTVPTTTKTVDNPNGDDDDDGLTNAQEAAYGTDPNNSDTDADYVNDFAEIQNHTNPLNPNEDGDTLIDGAEYWSSTNCNLWDTDGNGVEDGAEDADGDGYTNYEETSQNFDPKNPDVHPSHH